MVDILNGLVIHLPLYALYAENDDDASTLKEGLGFTFLDVNST